MDCVVIPHEDNDVDLELIIQKSLLDSESEFGEHRSNAKSVIDTKGYKGDLSRYMPTKGTFSYIHIDIDAKGGLAKMIENTKKFGQH